MRRLQASIFTAVLMAGTALAMPSQAQALRAADLNAPGDGLLTIDNSTGLEFLDVNSTVGLSFNQTLQTPFVTQQGFRFATFDEFTQLLTNAGFTDFSGNFNTADEPATENLLSNFLGETIPPGMPFTLGAIEISDGFYSYVTGAPGVPAGMNGVVGVDYQSFALGQAPQDQARVSLSFNQFPPDASPPIAGGLLVRGAMVSPVPEPSAMLLMAVGGLGLGVLVRRRRRGDRIAGATA